MSHFYLNIHEARIREASRRLKHETILDSVTLDAAVAVTSEPVPWQHRLSLNYSPIRLGETWGDNFACGWFHVTGAIPETWKGAYVTLNMDFGGELMVFDESGCPVIGLTNGSVFDADYSKDLFHFLREGKGGEKIDLWIDAGANGLFGLKRSGDPAWDHPSPHDLHGAWRASVANLRACRFDYDRWQLALDLEVILSLLSSLPEKSSRRIHVARATSRALNALPDELGGAAAVRETLRRTVWGVGADPASVKVTAIGHAHIDTAWLWPLRETVRKVARTFSSQIGLIERYPGYKFGASQAQLYALCKENYPALYEKVKKAVAAGAWEVQGGMWVEADCNIPSGESLIRQFLCGMRFFKEEMGVVPRNLWLPDVFGYSGNLPQIMRQCGIGFFLSQKLSWNHYNKFPHNSFVWEGIDGSRVVSHFPPEDTYNARLLPEELRRHETCNREAGIVDLAISLFGIGDGGGGPKEEYIERGIRCAGLNGCPPVHFGFAQWTMDEIATQKDDLDVWRGELYFERHRGTYTTQASQKLANRRAEEALRASEMLCAAAFAADSSTLRPHSLYKYPQSELTTLWRSLLLCQFHDIIPGSSIHRVYEESGALVRSVAEKARTLAVDAAATILSPEKDALTLFNPSSSVFKGRLALPFAWEGAEYDSGSHGVTTLLAQREGDTVFAFVEVAPRSFATLRRKTGDTRHATCDMLRAADVG
ncbi:MAG: alpha-mannosidase 2c1, partial [Kiritimatiellae bacterium]|nr:alpha-mannosidase 2c1 [Kiritimatiellia bacterium]